MGHIYTPGLKVTEYTLVRKKRILPLKGTVTVNIGDQVKSNTIIAETFLPGKVNPINIANALGVDAEDVEMHILKKIGEPFKKDEIYAQNKGFFGFFKTSLKAPFDGTIESISRMTGQAILRGQPEPIQMEAYIEGKIVDVIPDEGVEIETNAAFIQGIFGIGGERYGEIVVLAENNNKPITSDMLKPEHKGKVIIGGSFITSETYKKANDIGVHGIVVGGIDDADLRELLGYDIGVAITGSEEVVTTLITTEGFGEIPMANRTFNLLKKFEGYPASINGATQIRAGVIRPEIVICQNKMDKGEAKASELVGLTIGSQLRVIRVPYFGKIGKVVSLPHELTALQSESKARVLEVEFDNGERAIVPRANVEMIED